MTTQPLTPVADHLARVLELGPLTEVVELPAVDAVGLRLAEDVVATVDLPAFASSALDGYAVRAADVPGVLAVVGEVVAGQPDAPAVGPGEAVRIMTGGVVPAGADAVLGVEVAQVGDGGDGGGHGDGGDQVGGVVRLLAAAEPGAAVRPAGSDVRAGAVVLRAGQRIAPAQLAALLSLGAATVPVRRRPRVLVVSTGDELVDAGTPTGPAQLVDSNRPALLAAVRAAGAEPVDGGRAPDDVSAFLRRIDRSNVDLVVTSGGVSMGDRDVVKLAMRTRGVRFDRVAMQPGMPQAWGVAELESGPRPFVGLPGNPVSALVSFTLFVRPLLDCPARSRRAVLATAVRSSSPLKQQYRRGRMLANGRVELVGGSGSHQLATLAGADVLVVVPVGVTELAAGDVVDVVEMEPTWS